MKTVEVIEKEKYDNELEEDKQKCQDQKDYLEYYKVYTEFANMVWLKIENLMILPTIGVVAYEFNKLNATWSFWFIIIVSAAPLISSGLVYVLAVLEVKKILFHIQELQTLKQIQQSEKIINFNKKMALINNWIPFTLVAAIISIFMAGMIKFDVLNLLKIVSIALFIVYFFALCIFLDKFFINKKL